MGTGILCNHLHNLMIHIPWFIPKRFWTSEIHRCARRFFSVRSRYVVTCYHRICKSAPPPSPQVSCRSSHLKVFAHLQHTFAERVRSGILFIWVKTLVLGPGVLQIDPDSWYMMVNEGSCSSPHMYIQYIYTIIYIYIYIYIYPINEYSQSMPIIFEV